MLLVFHVLLVLAALVSALATAFAHRPEHARLGLGVNALSLAAIAWTLSGHLVAAAWATVGIGVTLASLMSLGQAGRSPIPSNEDSIGEKNTEVAPIVIGLLFCATIGATLLVDQPPAQISVGGDLFEHASETTASLVALLHTDYALAAVGVALILLVAVIGIGLDRRER